MLFRTSAIELYPIIILRAFFDCLLLYHSISPNARRMASVS
jgi:hypothetical protein